MYIYIFIIFYTKIFNSTFVFNINVFREPNQHIGMISDGYDPNDWSNNAKKNQLLFTVLKYINLENRSIVIIFHNVTYYSMFYHMVSIRDFFQKH